MGNKALFPVPAIVSNDIPDSALIDGIIAFQKTCSRHVRFISCNDLNMILQRKLGVRNHGGKEQGVGLTAGFTGYPTDAEAKFTFGGFDKTLVVAMDRQTTGMSTSALKLVKLKICNKRIIKSWRKGIVFFYE